MQRIRLIISCLFLLSTTSLLFGQAVSSCVPSSSTPGSTVTVSISGANVDFNSATTYAVELRDPLGSVTQHYSPTVFSSNHLNVDLNIPGNAVLGNYDIRVQGTALTWVPGLFSVVSGPPNAVGTISGHVFDDENGNCVQDIGEADWEGAIISLQPGPYYAVTNASGDYTAQLIPGTYTINAVVGPYQNIICPTTPINVNLPSVGATVSGQDFGIAYQHITNGSAYCSTMPSRPGFEQFHYLTVQNNGYYPLTGTLEYILDSNYNFLSANPVASSVSGDTVRWLLSPPIPQFGSQNYVVHTSLPTTTQLGLNLHCQTRLLTDSIDVDTEDNFSDCYETVVGSFDPNDKMVWNEAMLPADPFISTSDSILIYRIRFQNTGTASAINIFVRDTLDGNLDPASFKTIGFSHQPMEFTMTGEGAIEWRFPGIELPDSNTNEPESHGFILCSVKIKPGFGTGETIRNKAYIYFDFNEPVITNETRTSFVVAIKEPIVANPIHVFPNPAKDKIAVQMDCNGSKNVRLELRNAFGQLVQVLEESCETGTFEFQVSSLDAGIYFVRTELKNRSYTRKVVLLK